MMRTRRSLRSIAAFGAYKVRIHICPARSGAQEPMQISLFSAESEPNSTIEVESHSDSYVRLRLNVRETLVFVLLSREEAMGLAQQIQTIK
jgi:hypothetical protein